VRARRVVALAALVAVVVAAAGIVISAGGGGHAPSPVADHNRPARPKTIAAGKRRVAPRIVSGPHDHPVPILMYHVINSPPAGAAYGELWVPAVTFAAQMHALRHRRFHAVTLGQVWDYWKRGIALPHKPVVLSFDDGYLSDYTKALPVLESLHWPGVLNLVLHNLGPGGLSRHMVGALIGAGWEVDSHTINHLDLTTLDAASLRHELVDSRRRIRRLFGVPARFFCYPAGRFDSTVEAALKRAGYDAATTELPGLARPDRPFELARIRVNGTDSAAALVAKLAAAGA